MMDVKVQTAKWRPLQKDKEDKPDMHPLICCLIDISPKTWIVWDILSGFP